MAHFNIENNTELCSFYNVQLRVVLLFPSLAYYIIYVFGCVFNIVLTISAICLNSLSIIVHWKSPQLRRKKSYFLIMVLSVNDLVVGILGNASHAIALVLHLNGDPECNMYILVDLLAFPTAAMSFATLFTLNIERYLSIVHPIYHRTKVSKIKLVGFALVLWTVSIGLTLAHLTLGEISNILTSSIMYGIFLATCYIYFRIFRTGVLKSTSISSLDIRNRLQNMKLAKSCAIVVICTLVCYLPFAVVRSLEQNSLRTLVLTMWGVTFALAASSLNNVVFLVSNPVFRNEVKKIFGITCILR